MPYMVAPMAYMPVGVVRSPSTLWSLKPLPPRRIGIGGSAGRQYPLTFWNVSSVPVVTPYPLAYATITWVVPAGRGGGGGGQGPRTRRRGRGRPGPPPGPPRPRGPPGPGPRGGVAHRRTPA